MRRRESSNSQSAPVSSRLLTPFSSAVNLRQLPFRVGRSKHARSIMYVIIAVCHVLLALSAARFLQRRSQDALPGRSNILCGVDSAARGEMGGLLQTDPMADVVLADERLWREVCELQFAVGGDGYDSSAAVDAADATGGASVDNSAGSDKRVARRKRKRDVVDENEEGGDEDASGSFQQQAAPLSLSTSPRQSAYRSQDHINHNHGPGLVPQFDRFLMFFTDCWPHAYAEEVFKHYESHAQIFLVNIPGAKYSHAIYTAYLTGQLPTNYEGKPIAGDHLVRSMKRSFVHRGGRGTSSASITQPTAKGKGSSRESDVGIGSIGDMRTSSNAQSYPLRYIGPEWSFLAIFGKDNYDTFFDAEVHIFKESLNLPFEHPYPFFFESDSDRDFWLEYTAALAASGQSMMAHTGVMDHRQHGEHRGLGAAGTAFPRTDEMAKVMQKDMSTIKSFIDAHPEYLLVLASDHGVDEFDFSGYKMHGESQNGNEPFVLFYNPRLPAQGLKWIDVVDVAPTISTYLRGVDIPLNALGVTHAYFGESFEARRAEAGAIKQSLVQLNQAAARRGVVVDQDRLETLLTRPFEDDMSHPRSSNETQLGELRQFAMAIKSDIYTIITMPLVELGILTVSTSMSVLVVLLNYNDRLEIFVISEDYLGFAAEMARSLLMYSVCFLNLMFCWWGWGTAADGGFVFRIFGPALCLLVFRNIHTDSRPSANVGLVAAAESLMFHNEILNAVLQGITSCLPSFVSWIDGPGLGVFGFVSAVAGTLVLCWHATIYHSDGSRFLGIRERNIMIASVWSSLAYSYTSDMESLFFSGFHIFALPTFIFGLVVFPLRYLLQRRLPDIGVAMALVMHLVSKDNATRQLVIWLCVYQMYGVILPLVEAVRLQMCRLRGHDLKHKLSVTGQAISLYLLNQAFYTFYFGFGDKINFDVHPFSGAIGMQAYDTFKALSAFLMALHKYGVFVLLILASASFSQSHRLPDPRGVARWLNRVASTRSEKSDNISDLGTISPAAHLKMSYWMADHFAAATALFGVCIGLGFYLMFSIAARYHPFEQATCTLLLSCFIGFGHASLSCVLQALDRIRRP